MTAGGPSASTRATAAISAASRPSSPGRTERMRSTPPRATTTRDAERRQRVERVEPGQRDQAQRPGDEPGGHRGRAQAAPRRPAARARTPRAPDARRGGRRGRRRASTPPCRRCPGRARRPDRRGGAPRRTRSRRTPRPRARPPGPRPSRSRRGPRARRRSTPTRIDAECAASARIATEPVTADSTSLTAISPAIATIARAAARRRSGQPGRLGHRRLRLQLGGERARGAAPVRDRVLLLGRELGHRAIVADRHEDGVVAEAARRPAEPLAIVPSSTPSTIVWSPPGPISASTQTKRARRSVHALEPRQQVPHATCVVQAGPAEARAVHAGLAAERRAPRAPSRRPAPSAPGGACTRAARALISALASNVAPSSSGGSQPSSGSTGTSSRRASSRALPTFVVASAITGRRRRRAAAGRGSPRSRPRRAPAGRPGARARTACPPRCPAPR